MPMSIADNYHRISDQINNIAQKCGRNPAEITLVAVSKGIEWEKVLPAYEVGCRNFGENRIQEALPKMLQAPSDVRWHMIGTLQKNKVRKTIGKFVLIHSVDTPEIAQKISECSIELGFQTAILLEVNTSGESSKHASSAEVWERAFESLLEMPGIRIEGLMTMAPLVENTKLISRCFADLRLFRDKLAKRAGNRATLQHLSMGMSRDYLLAIAEGATLVRIGTAIFR